MDKVLTANDISYMKKIMKRYRFDVSLLVITIISGLFFYIYTTSFYEPRIKEIFRDFTELQPGLNAFLKTNNEVYSKPAFYFFIFLIGYCAGNIVMSLRLKRILRKMNISGLEE